jgi:hypothetical protein
MQSWTFYLLSSKLVNFVLFCMYCKIGCTLNTSVFLAFSFKMMMLRIGDKCELILIYKEARVAFAVEGSGLATSA